MDTKTLDKIIELKQKGLSLREIGILVKMSPEGVRNTINKYCEIKRNKKYDGKI
jgi:lambda repressor-like predicted transcriptional regulator